MITLSERQSRYFALALLVVVASLILSALAYPWLAVHAAQSADIEHKQKQLEIYRKLAASEAQLRQELATLQRRNPTAAYYVSGETEALASARMQQYVKQIVDQHGGELISTQVVQSEREEAAASTVLNVHLRSDLKSSSQILYQLESGQPLLFADNLTISARLVRGAKTGGPPQVSLDMNLDLTGYLQEAEK